MPIETLVLATALPVLVALLCMAFASRPTAAVAVLLLVELGLATGVAPAISLGAIALYPGDLLAAALAVAAAIRWRRRAGDRHLKGLLLAFIALLSLSVVRGVVAFGLEESVAAARELLGFATAAAFFSTVSTTPRLIRSVRTWLLAASAVVLAGALGFWVERGFGTYQGSGERALNAQQALIVLMAVVVTIIFPLFRGPILRWAVPAAGVVVLVLSTQRTVWAAAAVATAVLMSARPGGRARAEVNRARLLALGAVLAVVLLVAAGPQGARSDLTTGYERATGEETTFSWRLEGWSALLERQLSGTLVDLVIGSPSGTGEARVINGATVEVGAHSMYVSTFTMTGIIGIALLVWAYLAAFVACRRRLLSNSTFVGQAAVLFMVLLALDLTFFVGYPSAAISGLILGLACGFAGAALPGPVPAGPDKSAVGESDEADTDADEASSPPARERAPARTLIADPFHLLTGPESSPPAQG